MVWLEGSMQAATSRKIGWGSHKIVKQENSSKNLWLPASAEFVDFEKHTKPMKSHAPEKMQNWKLSTAAASNAGQWRRKRYAWSDYWTNAEKTGNPHMQGRKEKCSHTVRKKTIQNMVSENAWRKLIQPDFYGCVYIGVDKHFDSQKKRCCMGTADKTVSTVQTIIFDGYGFWLGVTDAPSLF